MTPMLSVGSDSWVPIDDVELGQGGLFFRDIVELRKQDAKAQEDLCSLIATVLEQACAANDEKQKMAFPPQVTVFHGQRPPNITPRQYIERIATYSGCSPCCLVMGMKYLDALRLKDPIYDINSLNFHRLVLTSVLVAAKFVDDFYYSNGYWAKVGGVKVDELNDMETEFLFLSSFNLHVKRGEYDAFVRELRHRISAPADPAAALSHGMSRLAVGPALGGAAGGGWGGSSDGTPHGVSPQHGGLSPPLGGGGGGCGGTPTSRRRPLWAPSSTPSPRSRPRVRGWGLTG